MLVKLKNDGSELVSNVQIACHAREDIRRTEEDEIKRIRSNQCFIILDKSLS